MDEKFLVCYRKHNWNYYRTFSYSFKILEIINFFVSFSIFIHSFSIYSLLILILFFYQHYFFREFHQINICILSFFQFFNISQTISRLWWAFLILFLFIVVPFIRYMIEPKRKCAIWQWDECKFIVD